MLGDGGLSCQAKTRQRDTRASHVTAPGAGTLYVVATPIGNLEDLSPRALRTLREVDLVACEDTRRTGPLLRAQGITTALTSYFEHNESAKGALILERLRAGDDVALVSDAGTPAISDPGFKLVRDARSEGFAVVPVPGPSAAVTALCVSGLPTDRFTFLGFLPRKAGARRHVLEEVAPRPDTLVVYEAPHRILATLDELRAVLGDRPAFLCREATKLHEEYRPGRLSELHALLAARPDVKGEIVLVVGGAERGPAEEADPQELMRELMGEGMSRKEASRTVAQRLGLPARDVYRDSLDAPGNGSEPDES
jgi:16S rRNA (cytidine1402-2'-O)-methyltransferase